MAFLPIHGHHRIQRCSTPETELFRVFNGFFQVVVAIPEQLPGHGRVMAREVEGQAVSLRVPITRPPVLLPCEPFGTDVQSRVIALIGLIEVEHIEAYALLGSNVSTNGDVRFGPNFIPTPDMVSSQTFITLFKRIPGKLLRGFMTMIRLVVQGCRNADNSCPLDGLAWDGIYVISQPS